MSVDRAQSSSKWRTRDANATRPTAEPAHKRQAKNPLFRWENREDRSPFEDRKELQGEVAHRVADNARIYVGNMPYTAQKEDVKKLFEEYAIEM
jgi:RNA recognition motif-containing protein